MSRQGFMLRCLCRGAALLLLSSLAWPQAATSQQASTKIPSVGLPGRLTEVVLPAPELEVRARDAKDPLVLRITRVAPHGDAFRYDFEYVGLEPGKYDLRDALRHKDGTPISTESGAKDAVPSIPVEVQTILAAGIVKPHPPQPVPLPSFGGYRRLLIAAGVAWLFGAFLILFGWRKRQLARAAAEWKPRTLAERLRPLVESAVAGKLSREERAQLELGLVAYWRRKLALEDTEPALSMVLMRDHAEAGPLLKSLEAWLHMPVAPVNVDLQSLLAPYRNLPADAIPEIDAARAAVSSRATSATRR